MSNYKRIWLSDGSYTYEESSETDSEKALRLQDKTTHFYKSTKDIPKLEVVRDAFKAHIKQHEKIAKFLEKTVIQVMGGPSQVGSWLFEETVFSGRDEPHNVYADDGNTRVSGRSYGACCISNLLPNSVNDYDWYYRGHCSTALITGIHIDVRESDGQVKSAEFSLHVFGWEESRDHRVCYSGHSADMSPTRFQLVEAIKRLVDIVKLREVYRVVDEHWSEFSGD